MKWEFIIPSFTLGNPSRVDFLFLIHHLVHSGGVETRFGFWERINIKEIKMD